MQLALQGMKQQPSRTPVRVQGSSARNVAQLLFGVHRAVERRAVVLPDQSRIGVAGYVTVMRHEDVGAPLVRESLQQLDDPTQHSPLRRHVADLAGRPRTFQRRDVRPGGAERHYALKILELAPGFRKATASYLARPAA